MDKIRRIRRDGGEQEMKFIVEKEFWEIFPEAKLGVVICEGLDNTKGNEAQYTKMLEAASEAALSHLTEAEFTANRVIRVWREAFQKFKTKKGARSSIEALLKRACNQNGVGTINPLVDLYNTVSLKYALPCGGENIDAFVGDVRLTTADGSEDFVVLGSGESAPPHAGEIVYKDDAGAICRCWNWREAVRTMLTEETKNAFLCIELVDASREREFEEALHELADSVKEHLGAQTRIVIVDKENPQMTIR